MMGVCALTMLVFKSVQGSNLTSLFFSFPPLLTAYLEIAILYQPKRQKASLCHSKQNKNAFILIGSSNYGEQSYKIERNLCISGSLMCLLFALYSSLY